MIGRNRTIHLSFNHFEGSVQYYYHFLLGFMLPLVLWQKRHAKATDRFLLRSCGPMDAILTEIGIQLDEIVPADVHGNIKKKKLSKWRYQFHSAEGFDHSQLYDSGKIAEAVHEVQKRLQKEIDAEAKMLAKQSSHNSPKIVMIDRAPPSDFYQSEECDLKGAGASRRSIANFGALFDGVRKIFPNTMACTLEDRSLAFQIALFRQADVVVAQHGAALANIIWCDPEVRVLEIHPRNLLPETVNAEYFLSLANCMKLNYSRVVQEHGHSEVVLEHLIEALNESLRS